MRMCGYYILSKIYGGHVSMRLFSGSKKHIYGCLLVGMGKCTHMVITAHVELVRQQIWHGVWMMCVIGCMCLHDVACVFACLFG